MLLKMRDYLIQSTNFIPEIHCWDLISNVSLLAHLTLITIKKK